MISIVSNPKSENLETRFKLDQTVFSRFSSCDGDHASQVTRPGGIQIYRSPPKIPKGFVVGEAKMRNHIFGGEFVQGIRRCSQVKAEPRLNFWLRQPTPRI